VNKILRVAISGTLLGWLAWHTDWQRVSEAFAHLQVQYWLLAVVILVITQAVSARRWQKLAQALGMQETFARLTSYYFIGMFFNLVLPTSVGGDVVRAYYLTKRSGKKLPAFVSVAVDRLNGLIVLLALACVAATLMYQDLPDRLLPIVWGTALCGWLAILSLPWLARWGKNGPVRIQQVRTMLQLMHHPRLVVQTTLYSLFIQVANVVLVWQVGLALQVDIPAGYYWVMVPMVSVLTLLPISVNGMGVREGGTALMLAPLGVNQATALALAFLWFAVFATVSLLGGLVYLFGRFPKPQNPAEETDGSLNRDSDQGRTGQLDQAA
jgi:uncharacterized membrane protein YbhN (UPF0104 family)